MPLVGDDVLVPLLGGGTAPHLNLDIAASAPALVEVAEVVSDFLPWYSSVHRGPGFKSQVATEAYEAARSEVAAFVGARADDVVVFTRNTTDAMNVLSSALPTGSEIVVFEGEHHANLLPWRRHRVHHLPLPENPQDLAPAAAAAVSEVRRGGAAQVLVGITGASNVTGEVWPVADIVAAVAEAGACTVVDAAQLAPHGPVELARWGADWVALSGHKLYAPYGAGALIGRRQWLEDSEPHLRGGGAVRLVTLESVTWAGLPDRQEAGSPNVVGAVALGAACRALARVGMQQIADEEATLAASLDAVLDGTPGVSRLRMWPGAAMPRIAVASFVVDGLHHSLVAAALSGEHGISVRDGCFCAHPLLLRLLRCTAKDAEAIRAEVLDGCLRSLPGAVRASAGLGATSADVDRLAQALRSIAVDGPKAAYRFDDTTGAYMPDPDDRPRPAFLGGSH